MNPILLFWEPTARNGSLIVGSMDLVREIIIALPIYIKKGPPPTCTGANSDARKRRSTATGFIVAPRMLRQGYAHKARVEPKCRHSTRFAGGKPHGTTITISFTYFHTMK